MLHDKAKIYVEGGRGGDGCVSFRREAHVPKGGPDGGDGGRGGRVVLVSDRSRKDLASFSRLHHFRAANGGNGSGSRRHGADGEDIEIPVSVGTVVTDLERGHVFDMSKPGQKFVVASGGRGGRGNKHFAGPTRQTPRFGERGDTGESTYLSLKLKLLADVALVGKPNAGKSLLLSKISRARPKVADYPFTTTEPVLGVVEKDGRQLVVADIPGLIEGAADGAGLGREFLAHIERTGLLVHVVEVLPLEGSDPSLNFKAVVNEISQYKKSLAELPQVVALSKCDLANQGDIDRISESLTSTPDGAVEVYPISSVTGAGLDRLKWAIFEHMQGDGRQQLPEQADEPASYKLYTPAENREITVSKISPGAFKVSGRGVERLVERFDLENRDALDFLEQRIKKLGVVEMLEREGFKSGNEIVIGDAAFEFWV